MVRPLALHRTAGPLSPPLLLSILRLFCCCCAVVGLLLILKFALFGRVFPIGRLLRLLRTRRRVRSFRLLLLFTPGLLLAALLLATFLLFLLLLLFFFVSTKRISVDMRS
jgi:hypothetical protein